MKTKFKSLSILAAAALAMIGFTLPAQAEITITSGANATTPDVSNTDLLQTSVATTAFGSGNFTGDGSAGTGVLTDGSKGSTASFNSIVLSTVATVGSGGGQSATYTFDLTTNTSGYTVNSIQALSGWENAGRDGMHIEVLYSTVAAPTTFISLGATGQINGPGGNDPFWQKAVWTHSSGVIASSVAAIQFNFNLPVENGYVGLREIDVIGTAVVAGIVSDPYFAPLGGAYSSDQSVSIASLTSGATIHYTTDGTTPTTGSPVYSGPLTVASTQTIKALAVKSGETNSGVTEATYTFNVATPVPTIPGGTYNSKPQTVSLSSATPGAVIYYTLDGSTPDNISNGTLYTAPIVVSDDVTISAIAYKGLYDPSEVWVGTYVFQVQTPVFGPIGDTYPNTQNVTITTNPGTAAIYYTTNGTDPDNIGNGTLYTTPVVVSATTTLKAIAYETGYLDSAIATDTYTIAPLPLGTSYVSNALPFTVSATDLVNGLEPVVIGTSSSSTGNQIWNRDSSTGASAVNDGVYGGRATVGGNSAGVDRAATANAGGLDIIWNFDTPQDISRLALYFSWSDGGRDNAPAMEIYASTSEYVPTDGPVVEDGQFCTAAVDAGFAANGGFTLLGTTVNTAPSGTDHNIKVNVMPLVAGNLASGVRSLYIRFGAAENEFVGCNEIDVFGAAPASNDYASWANANGVTGGVNGDSDNDGIKNLVEYALADGTSGTYIGGTLSFTKRGGIYGTDITYSIEESTNLSVWTVAASTQNAATISYVFTGPVPAKKFARLKVTQP